MRVYDDNGVATRDVRDEPETPPYSVHHHHILTDLAQARAATIALLADRVGMEPQATRAVLLDLRSRDFVRRSSRGWVITELGHQQCAVFAAPTYDVAALIGDDLRRALAASTSSVFAVANQLTRTYGDLTRVFGPSLELGRIAQSLRAPLLPPEILTTFSTIHLAGRLTLPSTMGLAAAVGKRPGIAALADSQSIGRVAGIVMPNATTMNSLATTVAGLHVPALDRLSLSPFSVPNGIFGVVALPLPSLFSNQALLASIAGRVSTVLGNFPALAEWWNLFESGRMEAAFAAIGLPPSLSMGMRLIRSVIRWYESGAAPERIRAAVLAYYDANDCAELAGVVDRLRASPDMARRVPTLDHAFLNHQEGRDAGTVFMLIPMVEGILAPAIRQMAAPTTKLSHNKMSKLLLSSPMVQTVGRIEGAMLRAAATYLQDRFFKDFRPGDPLEDQVRHPYVHGVIPVGTRMESLACFLTLDAIVGILALCRENGILT